jgi:hypothetical protein
VPQRVNVDNIDATMTVAELEEAYGLEPALA